MNSADVIRELRAARPAAGDALRDRVRTVATREPEARTSPLARFSGWRRATLIAVPTAAALAVATAGAIGLAGSGDGSGDRFVVQAPARENAAPPGASSDAGTESAKTAPSLGAQGSSTSQGGQIVIVPQPGRSAVGPTSDRAQRFSATLTLEVADTDELSDATQSALRIARDLGGFAANVSYASAESGVASLTLRIPTERVQDAIARLSGLGTIVNEQVHVDDLQEGLDELRARQAALRTRITRLTARLQDTELGAVERASLEAARRVARTDLAAVTSSARATVEEASLATIQLGLQTDQQSLVPAAQSRFDRALDRAIGVLAWEGVAVLFAAIVAAPFLALALVLMLWRELARRRGNASMLASS